MKLKYVQYLLVKLQAEFVLSVGRNLATSRMVQKGEVGVIAAQSTGQLVHSSLFVLSTLAVRHLKLVMKTNSELSSKVLLKSTT